MRGRAGLTLHPLIPAKAGTQIHPERSGLVPDSLSDFGEIAVGFTWVPAFAGMSGVFLRAQRDPSSDRSPPGHLLPPGEKGFAS